MFHVTKAPGRYSFAAHVRKGGGLFKKERLQWFAGYQDQKNFLLFQTDGKHLTVREVVDGKGSEVRKIPMDVEPTEWLQVEMTVQPNEISTRVRLPAAPGRISGPCRFPGETSPRSSRLFRSRAIMRSPSRTSIF